jgi:Cys-rich protein (TIGR01571 family)
MYASSSTPYQAYTGGAAGGATPRDRSSSRGGVAPPYGAPPATAAPYVVAAMPVLPPSSWSSALWECASDLPSCAEAACCACCQAGYQYNMLHSSERGPHIPLSVALGCFDAISGGLGTRAAAFYLRNLLREVFNITGSSAADLAFGFCCPWCTLALNYRELAVRGRWCGGVCVTSPPPLAQPMGRMT